MKTGRFLISSLVAAGFLTPRAEALPGAGVEPYRDKKPTMFERFRLHHLYSLAGHRSHSSHGSHGSHRSSSGGGYTAPRVNPPVRTTPPVPLYRAPSVVIPPYRTRHATKRARRLLRSCQVRQPPRRRRCRGTPRSSAKSSKRCSSRCLPSATTPGSLTGFSGRNPRRRSRKCRPTTD